MNFHKFEIIRQTKDETVIKSKGKEYTFDSIDNGEHYIVIYTDNTNKVVTPTIFNNRLVLLVKDIINNSFLKYIEKNDAYDKLILNQVSLFSVNHKVQFAYTKDKKTNVVSNYISLDGGIYTNGELDFIREFLYL